MKSKMQLASFGINNPELIQSIGTFNTNLIAVSNRCILIPDSENELLTHIAIDAYIQCNIEDLQRIFNAIYRFTRFMIGTYHDDMGLTYQLFNPQIGPSILYLDIPKDKDRHMMRIVGSCV